jgi:hypothetical protein
LGSARAQHIIDIGIPPGTTYSIAFGISPDGNAATGIAQDLPGGFIAHAFQ